MTLQDDNVGVVSQLCTRSNEIALREMLRHRAWRGYMLRHWICRDVEPSIAFLAKASWEETDTESVYREHATRTCGGEAASEMIHGFGMLEDLTLQLDAWIGVGFPVPRGAITEYFGETKQSRDPTQLLELADAYDHCCSRFTRAKALSRKAGKTYAEYYEARLLFSGNYMRCLALVLTAAAARREAEEAKEKRNWVVQAEKRRLEYESMREATEMLREGIQAISTVVQADARGLGLVATLNEYFYKTAVAIAHQVKMQMDEEQGNAAT